MDKKEALKILANTQLPPEAKNALFELVPELRKNEDKEVFAFVFDLLNVCNWPVGNVPDRGTVISYLDKWHNKDLIKFTGDDAFMLETAIKDLENYKTPNAEVVEWLKLLRDKAIETEGWSEEQAIGIENAIFILERCRGRVEGFQTDDGLKEHDNAIRTLKNLLPKKNGSPTVVQMGALKKVAVKNSDETLLSLYLGLKKLRYFQGGWMPNKADADTLGEASKFCFANGKSDLGEKLRILEGILRDLANED